MRRAIWRTIGSSLDWIELIVLATCGEGAATEVGEVDGVEPARA